MYKVYHTKYQVSVYLRWINPLSAKFIKWSNTLKQFVRESERERKRERERERERKRERESTWALVLRSLLVVFLKDRSSHALASTLPVPQD